MDLLETVEVTNAASLDLTAFDDTLYTHYHIIGSLKPITDAVRTWARLSTDGGASWISAAGSYTQHKAWFTNSTNVWGGFDSGEDTALVEAVTLGSAAGEEFIGFDMSIWGMHDTAVTTYVLWRGAGINTTGGIVGSLSAHKRNAFENNNAIQFLMASGNLTGVASLYGIE